MADGGVINGERLARDVIAVGASAGGIEALTALLAPLPAKLPAAILIVIHRSPFFEGNLPAVLGRRTAMPVAEPHRGESLVRGRVYVAPRDQHLVVDDGRLTVHRGPKQHHTRPAVDPLFESVAASHANRAVGVLLSGGGDDGVHGLLRIKAAGGVSLVQDPREALHPSMPRSAILYDHVDAVLPLAEMAATIEALALGRCVEVGRAPLAGSGNGV